MKRFLPVLACLAATALSLYADDQVRDVQTELKSQGFYFGDITGQPSNEYSSAIRRYQIRNGLQPSGQADDDLLRSLGLAGASGSAPAPAEPAPALEQPTQPPPATAPPPVNIRREDPGVESDRHALRQEIERRPRGGGDLPPPASVDDPYATPGRGPQGAPGPQGARPDPMYNGVFAGTPYRSAPQVVQQQTLRRAQETLASRGLYRAPVDGVPGPALEEAVLSFQRTTRLPLTGRLDLETLNALHLLPGRGPGNAPMQRGSSPTSRPVGPGAADRPANALRGVWVE